LITVQPIHPPHILFASIKNLDSTYHFACHSKYSLLDYDKMIDAVIFDMDGILLDSEPFWQEAEMEIFASVGIPLTREQCIETTGLPVIDVVQYRYTQHPWSHKSLKEVSNEILNGVELRVRRHAVPLDGAINVLEYFKHRQITTALASSSPMRLIQTVLEIFSLENAFTVIHSAEQEEYGKPHPAVFLTTAKRLNVPPPHCLVIEDSFNGLIAAKAARMKTMVIPMVSQWHEIKFEIADLKLKSLTEFSEDRWNDLNALP
jgi:mannitol-1-/sugar-/sorbitol-6-/2-deoxyglucose-6-phosphatase